NAARLPTLFNVGDYVKAGGLISYGPNFSDMFRRAAEYTDKILRGAKPGELPIEQATKFELFINLATAKLLGITIPGTILPRADEVIEYQYLLPRRRSPLWAQSGHGGPSSPCPLFGGKADMAPTWPQVPLHKGKLSRVSALA